MRRAAVPGLLAALLAAATFGGVNVAVRHAIGHGLQPLWAVAFAYLAGGLGMLPFLGKVRLPLEDRPKLAVSVAAGAVAGPLLLFFGLQRAAAGTASLVLNMEMAFTAALALWLLGERLGGLDLAGVLLLGTGAVLASLAGGAGGESSLVGIVLVAAAALAWSIDNAASAPLARRHDPRGLIAWKTVLGGSVVVTAAVLLAGPPGGGILDWALATGAGLVGVALSSVLFYVSLGRIGAARTTAIFATSSLWGVLLATLLLGEAFTWIHVLAVLASAAGVAVLALRPFSGNGTRRALK